MLRWKKQKGLREKENPLQPPSLGSVDGAVASSIHEIKTESPTKITTGVFLENIPNITMRGIESTNASVSSEGLRVTPLSTRYSDDETSMSSSSGSTSIFISGGQTTTETINKKGENECRRRKVSDVDMRSTTGTPEDVPVKKRRLSFVVKQLQQQQVQHQQQHKIRKLLVCDEDAAVLNPLHVFCRTQIEVFTATPIDVAQPSPGRKNPVQLHQVGLRCIHCRHFLRRDRVKRAICYPSGIGRIYHSVSDMKFDHFGKCKGLSQELRTEFETLRKQCKRDGSSGGVNCRDSNLVSSKRNIKTKKDDMGSGGGAVSSASTAQYYHDSAQKMGMTNVASGGIFMTPKNVTLLGKHLETQTSLSPVHTAAPENLPLLAPIARKFSHPNALPSLPARSMLDVYQHATKYQAIARGCTVNRIPPLLYPIRNKIDCYSTTNQATLHAPTLVPVYFPNMRAQAMSHGPRAFKTPTEATRTTASIPPPTNRVLLSMAGHDERYLNPIHCFVRRNVEVFVATGGDISAPAPGRKNRVTVGQVGIRCIHCAQLPVKERVKRAVCYPPSVRGIYHSISNMKFDHFGKCQALPLTTQAEFASLQSLCHRRHTVGGSPHHRWATGGADGGNTSANTHPATPKKRGCQSTTAQYYYDSARQLGLVDTATGIRFHQEPKQLQVGGGAGGMKPCPPLSAHNGLSVLIMAATNRARARLVSH